MTRTTDENHSPNCNGHKCKGGKDLIIITIETGHRRSDKRQNDTEKDEAIKGDDKKPVERLFKLPVLMDHRHHGPGCAMEINVLEKHDDSCVYKKDETEGRLPDDKVGSYDCIGRLVFRTCNPNELESESSGSHGINSGFSGVKPEDYDKAVSNSKQAIPPEKEQKPVKSKSEEKPAKTTVEPEPVPKAHSTDSIAPALEEADKPTPKGGKKGGKKKEPKKVAPKKGKGKEQQVVVGTTATTYQRNNFYEPLPIRDSRGGHPGDGNNYVYQPPQPPIVLRNSHLNRIMTSKKMFPNYTDEGNQTDPILNEVDQKFSQETISSLTDLSKFSGKRKPSFLGSIFRRNSVKSSSHTEAKKQFRR